MRTLLRSPLRSSLRQSLVRPLTSRSSVFDPLSLFSNGEQGAFYLPEPENLFQDAAGTTPVTADGDPVGLMLDKSGNGNHASQSVAARRPIYPGLAYDGVDDNVYFDRQAITAGTLYMTFARGSETTGILVGGTESKDSFVAVYASGATPPVKGGSITGDVSVDGVVAANRGELFSLLPQDQFRVVKVEGINFTAAEWKATTLQMLSYRLEATFTGNGKVNGFVLVEGSIDSETDQKVQSYLYNKAGVTL